MLTEGALKERNVRKWCRLFGDSTTNMRDAKPNGTDSLVKDGKAMQLEAWKGTEVSRR